MEGRIKNSTRNIMYGAVNRLVAIIIPFFTRTVIIKVLGEEYLGLNSLFSSILQVLCVAELGIGNAIVASMYKPIAENDVKTVSALLKLYRNIYRIIAIGIIIVGIVLNNFLRNLISGEPPKDVNINVLFLIYILNTTCSYLFFAHKIVLINAHQRADLAEKVGAVSKIITSLLQVLIIVFYKNITLYVFMNLVCTVAYNMGCYHIVNKNYPQYACDGELDSFTKSKIGKNVIALAIQKIGNTISVSLDTLVISAFLGLSAVAVYGNYMYIVSAVSTFILLIYNSITASIGNSIVVESKKKNLLDLKKFSFMNIWIVGWCSICLICLLQNFIKIWVGANLRLNILTVFAIVLCFYVTQIRSVIITYKDAAGMWYADKYKPLVGCIVNLVLNIMLVKVIGIGGVVISTIVSYLFIEFPWETRVLFRQYFGMTEYRYYKQILRNTLSIAVSGTITYGVCYFIPDIGINWFITKLIICLILPNAVLIIIYLKNDNFLQSYNMLKKIIGTVRGKRLNT